MPAAGAHYQFGQLILQQCPPSIAQHIHSNKAMFDVGTQGPDLLFFYRPYHKNPVSQLGHAIHSRSGHHLLLPLLPERESWSPPLIAYLLGLCCHYSLDRSCHPLIMELAPSNVEHQQIEAALDRLVFDRHAITTPRHKMVPTHVDIAALQQIYPQLIRSQLKEATLSLHYYNLLLEHPRLVGGLERLLGKSGSFSPMCLPTQVAADAPAHQILPLFDGCIDSTLHLMSLLLDGNTHDDTLLNHMKQNYEGAIS